MAGSGRTAEFGTKVAIRIEFYTGSYHASGDIEVSRWHITDLLNDKARPSIIIDNAIREPLPQIVQPGEQPLARATPILQIAKQAIILAVPHETMNLAAARQQYIAALYQERSQATAIVVCPPFELKGIVHLRRGFQVKNGFDELATDFIPVTELEATYIPDARIRINSEFAVINRQRAELVVLTDDGPKKMARGFRTE